jgi:hypothetical protein
MTGDEVQEALDAAAEAIAGLEPAIRQQIENAQQQINDATAAVRACHSEDSTNRRSTLADHVAQRAAAVEQCQSHLDDLRADEARQCAIAEDCLCDEARVRTQDQEALCQSVTETYEATYCESQTACITFHECHTLETEVYNRLRSDVEAEMAVIVQEYIAVEQAQCLTGLIMGSMASGNPIPHADLIACSNVDVSALNLVFPSLPEEPTACPAPTHGNPDCVASPPAAEFTCMQGAQNNHNQLGSFRGYTRERCEQECAANSECLSYDSSTNGNECYLSTTTAATGGGLRASDTGYVYCERNAVFTCVQGAQNGHNQLGAFASGYTRARCEQECATNSACLSYDTSINGNGCYLSSTTAATGGGLRATDSYYVYCEKI